MNNRKLTEEELQKIEQLAEIYLQSMNGEVKISRDITTVYWFPNTSFNESEKREEYWYNIDIKTEKKNVVCSESFTILNSPERSAWNIVYNVFWDDLDTYIEIWKDLKNKDINIK